MRKLIVSLLFAFLSLVVSTSNISAKVVTMQKGSIEIPKSEIINDDLFVAAETINIDGTINGDVYAGGGTVRITGIINGDLHVGAGTFYLNGSVRDDVYVGAGSVSLNKAKIGDSLILGSGNVNIDEDSSIGGSLLAGAGTINLYSPVARNVMVGAGVVSINSTIGGEARLGAGEISIGPNTKIAKDLYYSLGDTEKKIQMSQSAVVKGQVQEYKNEFVKKDDMERVRRGFTSAWRTVNIVTTIISLLGAFIVGYLWLKLFPKCFTEASARISQQLLRSLGIGFFISLGIIPALLVLLMTGVGAPLAGVTLLLFILGAYLSKLVVAHSFGNWITGKLSLGKMSVYGVFALGLVGVYLLKAIPVLGFFVSLVVFWTGLGALATYHKSK